MSATSALMTRWLVLLHRWLGIVLCLMFALWFASGAVLMYVPFPALPDADRLAHLQDIDFSRATVTPAAAIDAAASGALDRLRMLEMPEGPVYVLHPAAAPVVRIDARTGIRLDAVTAAAAKQIALHFAGHETGEVEGPLDYDQWIVHQRFDPYRPFYRIAVGDDRGTVLYVSARSGDVLQQTFRSQRIWNYLGAVVHWIYPTFLRKSWATWDSVVWWLSLVGIAMAVAGIWLGVMRSAKSLRNPRKASISPFRRWFRWHHIAGLSAGLFLLTWIFSGWLSMDHGRLFSSGVASAEQTRRFRGMPIETGARPVTLAQLAALGPATEAEIVTVGGGTYLVARRHGPNPVSIGLLGEGSVTAEMHALPDYILLKATQAAWPDVPVTGIAAIAAGDQYSRLIYEPLPAATRRVVLGDAPPTWVHIDATSGRIIQVMDRSRRIYRWLFSGLHSFDLPGLRESRLLRQSLMLLLLAAGFFLSLSGAVIGIKRLRRTFAVS